MSSLVAPSESKLLGILIGLPEPALENMFGQASTHLETVSGALMTVARTSVIEEAAGDVFLVSVQGITDSHRLIITAFEQILGPGTRDDYEKRSPELIAELKLFDEVARQSGFPVFEISFHYWPVARLDEYLAKHPG